MMRLDDLLRDPGAAAHLPREERAQLLAAALAVVGALAAPAVAADGASRPANPAPAGASASTEEYLNVKALAARIPYDEQTVRNLMSQGVFRLGVHYMKPGGKGRPVFKWSAVRAWLEGQPCPSSSAS